MSHLAQDYPLEIQLSTHSVPHVQGSMNPARAMTGPEHGMEYQHPGPRASTKNVTSPKQSGTRATVAVSSLKSSSTDGLSDKSLKKSTSPWPNVPEGNPSDTPSKFRTLQLQLVTIVASLALLAFVITYVQATYDAERSSQQGLPLSGLLKTKASTIISILRTSQGLLAMITHIAIDGTFTLLHWNGMALPQGLPYPTVLSLSPSTSAWGVFGIIRSGVPSLPTKGLAALRLSLPAFVWISGLVLFSGVGRFNGSLVDPFKAFLHTLRPGYPYTTVPYNYLASAYTLVVNPLIATVAEPKGCAAEPCISYLLSGGLTTVIPWVPRDHTDYSLVRVKHAPSIQADFTGPLAKNISFHDDDCDIFGQNDVLIGIRLCLKMNPSDSSLLMAGMFACPRGIAQGACAVGKPAPNITTQVSFHSLQASFVSSRKNYTITSIVDTTEATPILDLELPAYREALRWLLNYTDANIPPPTSIAQSFWNSQKQLSDPSTWGILEQNFQSILVFPFWLFNAHNWGNTQIKENETISTLPPEFYTEASLVEPYDKLRVDKGMFSLFLTLQIVAILFVSGAVGWVWMSDSPARKPSSFPLFDIVFRAQVQGEGVGKCPSDISDSAIISGLKDTRVEAA
ncbi:uncharacterized protein PG986_000695 [Apiospora aurea]|uniref:Uncharacterized protein n=1 Tax=Apiospora aurea TaxID=335848 RepID=A0ABR1QUU2_9PEZI